MSWRTFPHDGHQQSFFRLSHRQVYLDVDVRWISWRGKYSEEKSGVAGYSNLSSFNFNNNGKYSLLTIALGAKRSGWSVTNKQIYTIGFCIVLFE